MTTAQKQWLDMMADAAFAAHHIFPTMAACEAALESAHKGIFGASELAREDKNFFGTKQHQHPVFGTASLPTNEYLDGKWKAVEAKFVKYPTVEACFEDRMATLRRLESDYPHYAEALAATDPIEYVRAVSKTWSSDPDRAAHVIAIYEEWLSPDLPDSLNT